MDHIPMIHGVRALSLASRVYGDSHCIRIPLIRASNIYKHNYNNFKLWIDPCVDGFYDCEWKKTDKNPWYSYYQNVLSAKKIMDSGFCAKPNTASVEKFVNDILDRCIEFRPYWITVPQLPINDLTSYNKINKYLAEATGKWKSERSFKGSLIFPVLFTHHNQVAKKSFRTPLFNTLVKYYHLASADGYWAVDSYTDDESGSSQLRQKRYHSIIDSHKQLNEKLSTNIRIGGPYWGLNLVLWAKNLIDFPVISIGTGFKYYLSGTIPPISTTPTWRIAIPSLKRRVLNKPSLKNWFDDSLSKIDEDHKSYQEFRSLRHRLDALTDEDRAKEQVAKFYKSWFNEIASIPKPGRAIALFQNFVEAFSFGKTLSNIDDEKETRDPATIAEQLMLICLGKQE